MKKVVLLIMLLAGGGPAYADQPPLSPKQVLLNGSSAIVGTVLDVEGVGPEWPYTAQLKIRVDEVIATKEQGPEVGQLLSETVIIAATGLDHFGIKTPPESSEVDGAVLFDLKVRPVREGDIRAAVAGKQFFFSLHALRSDYRKASNDWTEIYALWRGDWVRSCWTGGACAYRAPWPGSRSNQQDGTCVAQILARQPTFSGIRVDIGGGDVYFTFVNNNHLDSGVIFLRGRNGQMVMGAPMNDYLRPMRDDTGQAITGRADDQNPLKTAIPIISDECHITYAGDGMN